MALDELTTALGTEPARKKRRLKLPPLMPVLGALVAAPLIVVAGWIAFVDDPLGGEPVAVVEIAKMTAPPKGEAEPAGGAGDLAHGEGGAVVVAPGVIAVPHGDGQAASANSAAEVEKASGVTVVRSGEASAPTAVIVRAPDAVPEMVTLVPPKAELSEKGRQGPLPRISASGERPADAYARPVVLPPAFKGKTPPRIAIMVTGMGISQGGTAAAITKLPPAVTLAFAPYGDNLDAVVQRARKDGHEVMLQTPMEPFDYPDSDPGPQTLISSATPEQNLDRLRWQMSRFAGYVGLTNYMGGKFTADEAALSPILKEVSERGLIFADDGSSPRSLVGQIAGTLGLPSPRAEMVIDAEPSPAAIDGVLAKLEQTAREKGSAFGVATGLPVTIDRISQWAARLEARGILLVPVTALAKK